MGFKLGQLVIELAANTARLQTDLGKAVGMAESAAGQFKKAFSFVSAGVGGGLIGAALIGAAKNAIEFGDSINKAAIKSGIGGKAMSELAYAAKLADVDIGSLSTGLKKMQVAISEAGTGSKSAQGAFAALGLTVDQIQKRKPEAQFELIADRISKLTDPADRARAATELFGKAGADLLPLFQQGAQGIAKAVAEARKLGLSFGDDDLNNLSTADDSVKRLSASWSGFAATLTAKVSPALSAILDDLARIDTRSTDTKIADLEGTLAPHRLRHLTPDERTQAEQELSNARGLRDLEQVRALQTGSSGGPQSRSASGYASGYAKQFAEDAAAAQQYARDTADVVVKSAKISTDAVSALYDQWASSALSTYDKETEAFYERVAKLDSLAAAGRITGEQYARAFAEAQDDVLGEVKVSVKKVSVQMGSQISATAAFFKDTFLQAFDDWINTGTFKFGQFLKYIAAEWARSQIANLFKNIGSSGSSSGSGWLSAIGSAVGSLFGGGGSADAAAIDGKAGGGPVAAGRTYLIGERGPELLHMGASAAITPNKALGGRSVTIHQANTFNGGDPDDLMRMLKESNRQLVDTLRREHLLVET